MPSHRTICVHCERYMTMMEAAVFFSSFGEVAALEISREDFSMVFVRFFEDAAANLLLDLIAKDLHTRVERKSRESPYIRPGTIITAWEMPVGSDKEFQASASSPALAQAMPVAADQKFRASPLSPALACEIPVGSDQEVWASLLSPVLSSPQFLQVLTPVASPSSSLSVGEAEIADDVMALGENSDNLAGDTHASLVIFEKVLNGEDRRTTIMVRNLPKKGNSSDFIAALKALDLWNRLNFYYMPFDKSRSRFCGFAFLDFRDPVEILRFNNAKFPENVLVKGQLGISYAHIQGLSTIRANFSESMIMEEPDDTKRPLFLS
eukprot:TRINITY_DN9145_c0_g1_i1.p1 TRINITY_DN9145_c0_g1~~TRINITY_DN9145_c0_g1_i1.p1  ORF type:complete len:322 (+),score=41.71 TRINITY_DN9145_c0_g1_i1:180-1145(+)